MKKVVLTLFTAILGLSLFGQSPYLGEPWNGEAWQFVNDNAVNFDDAHRVILWKYDIGPAHSPAETQVEPDDDLTWVIGMQDGRWRTSSGGETWRKDSADAQGKFLDPTDIALQDAWSNFQWDPSLNRPRDGGIWPRFTVNFEEGIYRFINRGYPNTNGNFDHVLTLRDTATMEIVYTSDRVNNLGDEGFLTTDLGTTPEAPYDDLPATLGDNQHWYAYNDVMTDSRRDDLFLEGPYIVEIVLWGSGAMGGQVSEFTFDYLLPTKPILTGATYSDISGCDGSTTITVTADPENPGDDVEYLLSYEGNTLEDWSAANSWDVYLPGKYTVKTREVGFTLTADTTFTIAKTGCDPTPYLGAPQTIPGTLEMEFFDLGGEGIAYHEITSVMVNDENWTARNAEDNGLMGVDLDSLDVDQADGVDTITVTNTVNTGNPLGDSEWWLYTVDVQTEGEYNIDFLYNCNNTNTDKGIAFELYKDGERYDVVDLDVYGTWTFFWGEKDSVPEDLTFADKWHDTTYTYPISLKAGTNQIKIWSGMNNMLMDRITFNKITDITPEAYANPPSVQQTVDMNVALNKNGILYVVPSGTNPGDDLEAVAYAIISVSANDTVVMGTDTIPEGDHLIYGVDVLGNVSAAVNITIEELVLPVISVDDPEALVAFPWTVTMDQDGKVYLVPTGTLPTDDLEAVALKFADVTADTPVEISTIGVDIGEYLMYGVNTDGTVSDSLEVSVVLTKGVNDVKAGFVNVYPTVVDNLLNIETNKVLTKIEIYNVLGAQVMSLKHPDQRTIDVSGLKQGIYIMNIRAIDEMATFKFIKR